MHSMPSRHLTTPSETLIAVAGTTEQEGLGNLWWLLKNSEREMRGWGELGVVDTIFEDDQEEEYDDDDDEDEDEDEDGSIDSFSLTPCATLTPSLPPHSSLPLPPPPSLQARVKEWTQSTGLKTDVVVRVQDKCFHLHKEPLVTHSGYFRRHLTESSAVTVSPPSTMTAETFAKVARFCYGGDVALTPSNLAALRVAAEWLEMGGEAGLVRRAEGYFFREVAGNAGLASAVLRSCAALLGGPDAEAAAAADVAVACVEVLAASEDLRWLEDVAALSAEGFGRIARSMRGRFADDHDLLYRVVDHYLHNHDGKLTEEEKSRICYNINCTKLSHHHLAHLVQNPRLPLRFVVQAMLIDQLHTRRCILDRAAAVKPRHHHRRSTSKTHSISSSDGSSRSHGDQQLTLGAILQRDAASRQSAHIRAVMEATSLRIQSLERDIAGLRHRLRWSEEKQAEMDSVRSASFRIVRPRGGELEEGAPAVVEASCDGHPARSGRGLGRRLVRGLRNMFRKSDRIDEGNDSSVGSTAGGGDDGGAKVMEVERRRPGHRRNGTFG